VAVGCGCRVGELGGWRLGRRALIEVAVFVGGVAHPLFEEAAEMLRIFEPECIGDLADGFGRVENTFFGHVDDFFLYILLGRSARFFFYQIPEIIGRQMELGCAGGHRWEAIELGLFT